MAQHCQTGNGGRVTSYYNSLENALSLVVENIGETRASGCTARLIHAERVGGGNDAPLDIFEPILLPWRPDDPEKHLMEDIDPGTSQRAWVAEVAGDGYAWIIRDTNALPADYQQIFGKPGTYHAVIQITDGTSLSVRVKVQIECWQGPARSPHQLSSGGASIAILEQDYSHPLHLGRGVGKQKISGLR